MVPWFEMHGHADRDARAGHGKKKMAAGRHHEKSKLRRSTHSIRVWRFAWLESGLTFRYKYNKTEVVRLTSTSGKGVRVETKLGRNYETTSEIKGNMDLVRAQKKKRTSQTGTPW